MSQPVASHFVDTAPAEDPPRVHILRPQLRSKPQSSPRVENPNVERICGAVAEFFGLTLGDVLGERKYRTVILSRGVAMFVVRAVYDYTGPEIGRYFGRDHSSVYNALDRADLEIRLKRPLKAFVDQLVARETGARSGPMASSGSKEESGT